MKPTSEEAMVTLFLAALVALLAFANGSNDNGKGVATLVGYGAARPLPALVYAAVATALGGMVSFFLASGMLAGFSGGWLFAHGVALDRAFYAAVLIGACGWVLIATWTGMPVSTTHAIIGALCGAGLVEVGNQSFRWAVLAANIAVPLAVSPVLALAAVYLLAWPVLFIVRRAAQRRSNPVHATLMQPATVAVESTADGAAPFGPEYTPPGGWASPDAPPMSPDPAHPSPDVSPATNAVHWLSCGLISFARGWNDTPKIAALSLLALSGVAHGTAIGFAIVTIAMACGGLLMGRKVLETLARKLTPLPLAESMTASLVTATLVGLASWGGLPVSTTQVATGSIVGAGLTTDPGQVKWAKVGEIVVSWIVTLPVAAGIAAGAMIAIRFL